MMISFKSFLKEAEADIENFLGKIQSAQTKDGLKELEGYYNKRRKEVEVRDADDITIRDAMTGRAAEIDRAEAEAAAKLKPEAEKL